jgi:sugar lactone lactonase YvrE
MANFLRRIGTGVLAAGFLVVSAAAAAPRGFVERYHDATQAYTQRDFTAMERHLRAALAERPGHPSALYRLAAAQSLGGAPGAALETLQVLAAMGLSYSPEQDDDFTAVREWPGFDALTATFERNRQPLGNPTVVLRVNQPDFIPHGIAYDGDTGSWYLGGVHLRSIARVIRGMEVVPHVLPGVGGLLAPLGMVADSRRRLLWVAHSGLPQMRKPDPDDLGRAGIIAYDLDTGQVKRRASLPDDGRTHELGHIERGPDGMLYVSDRAAGRLYHFDTVSGKFSELTSRESLVAPQGLALAADRRTLYVADYTQGLFSYDLKDGTLTRLDVAEGICVYGVDGLYRHGRNLVAVQNGVHPHRVILFRLDRRGHKVVSAEVLAANLTDFDRPALGLVTGNRFSFIANSQWDRFDKQHRLPPASQLYGPVVLRLTLPAS